MKKISRKEAIRNLGGLALLPALQLDSHITEHSISHRKIAKLSPDIPLSDKIILKPFNYREVMLDNGSLNRQVEYIKNYYLDIPNDDLLKGFRERVGRPVYGARNLGGWYSADVFNIFGQILSGLSRLYAVTGDDACKEKTNALIDGWAECLGPDGYFYYTNKPNAPHYVYDKMVGGLVDANLFTGNKKTLDHLNTITDWALKNLDRGRPFGSIAPPKGPDKEHTYPKRNIEWYTLSENLYRAYQLTNQKKYLDYAGYWEYSEYWNMLANKENIFKTNIPYHAYSHLNTLSGAAMAYMVKGDQHYLDTLKNGYDFFQNEQCFATGGYGPDEKLQPKEKLVQALRDVHNTFETQCGSWAVFKLCKYLLMFTGDARYGDWIEKMIYNGAGADIPLSPDGRVLYYSDYNPRESAKHNYYEGYTCCNGTRPQDVAEYAQLVYFHNDNGLYVDLYTPSHIDWNGATLIQTTRFPEENETHFEVRLSDNKSAKEFSLHFRKPGWASTNPSVSINGQPAVTILEQNWLKVRRTWKDGDKITVTFPMQLAIDRLDQSIKYPAAITYGPVVMAMRTGKYYPEGLLDQDDPFSAFDPVAGAPLNWHVKNMPDLLVRPYNNFKEGEQYLLYLDPLVTNRILEEHLVLTGHWDRFKGCGYFYSNQKDAAITTTFTGSGVRLYLTGFPNSGKCQVLIDGKPVETIDEYRQSLRTEFQREYNGLGEDKHSVSIKVMNEKNEHSRNTYINVNWIEVIT